MVVFRACFGRWFRVRRVCGERFFVRIFRVGVDLVGESVFEVGARFHGFEGVDGADGAAFDDDVAEQFVLHHDELVEFHEFEEGEEGDDDFGFGGGGLEEFLEASGFSGLDVFERCSILSETVKRSSTMSPKS